jgi:hypothetical protein
MTGPGPLLSLSDADNRFKAAHSILMVEIQSIRAVATGSIARLSHPATSSPKLWMSRWWVHPRNFQIVSGRFLGLLDEAVHHTPMRASPTKNTRRFAMLTNFAV